MSDNISKKIKYFNFIFTICIILSHTPSFVKSICTERASEVLYKFLFNSAVISLTYFFFMSGFLFYNNINSTKDCFIKLKKRVKSLIVPFLLWNLIVFIYSLVRHYLIPSTWFIYCDVDVLSLKQIYKGFFADPFCGPLWYLLAIFIMMIPSFIIGYIKKNKYLVLSIFLIIIGYLTFRTKSIFHFDFWWYGNLAFYLPTFMIGGYLGLYHPDLVLKKEYNDLKYTIIGIVMIVLGFLLFYYVNLKWFYRYDSLLIIIGLWFIIKPKLFKNISTNITNISFFVYALHQSVLMPLYMAVIRVIFKGQYNLPVISLISISMIIFILLTCMLLKFICEKVLGKKFTSLLTGGR